MLIQNTLFGSISKVDVAIKRLQEFEPQGGYYLAFSGGKDSIVIKHLADMARVKYNAHFHLTTVDPPELRAFVAKYHASVIVDRPPMSMFQLILKKWWPPMRHQRYCCEVFKERNGTGLILTGVRWAESPRRARRRMIESCMNNKAKTYLHPIIDWDDDDIWQFIHTETLDYCSLYDEGFSRIGCILCPMSTPERDIERWPKFVNAYKLTFQRLIEKRTAAGKKTTFADGNDLFEWWITRKRSKHSPQQMTFEF